MLGLCGGYQMLGRTIADPHGIEGAKGSAPGLGLLQVDTVIEGEKTLAEVSGTTIADAAPVKGYEMHMGVSMGADTARPMVRFRDGRADERGVFRRRPHYRDLCAWLLRQRRPASRVDQAAWRHAFASQP